MFSKRLKFAFMVLLAVTQALVASAQQKTVKGVVSDSDGPLIGVSVVVKGTSGGASTDIDGKYSVQVPSDDAVLVFSYVGFKTEEVRVGSSREINMTMLADENLLDDVVVVGYGTQAKSHLTGSISKIGGENFIDLPVSDVATALQGQVAGLTINNTTSEVGVSPTIRVRGTGSIRRTHRLW